MSGRTIRNWVLTLGAVSILSLADKAYSSFFNLGFTPASDQESVQFTGRLSFDDFGYPRTARTGDEVGFFRDNICIGFSSLIDSQQSHYSGLQVYVDDPRTPLIDGLRPGAKLEPGVDYAIKAYSSQDKSVRNVEIMCGQVETSELGVKQLDLRATPVPEPGTLSLLGLAAVLACRSAKSRRKSRG